MGTKLNYSTAYHPQTDGQSERVNQCLEQYLRCAVQDQPKTWRRSLAMAEFWYNTSYHTAIGCSPFKALYRTEPNFGGLPNLAIADSSTADMDILDYAQQTEFLRDKLSQAQTRMKRHADKNRTERQFAVGEQVLLKLQRYAQHSVVNRPCPKLSYKYFGPFTILERIGAVAYKLQLPAAAQVHPVFHVSQLKPFTSNYTPVYQDFPPVPDLLTSSVEPESILDRRMVRDGYTAATQILVKWRGLDAEQATWEDYYLLKQKFPTAAIWDENHSQAGEHVTPPLSDPESMDNKAPTQELVHDNGTTSQ